MTAVPLPSEQVGLLELADLIRAHVKSARLAEAYVAKGRYILELSERPDRPCDREAALHEVHQLLNTHEVYTRNGTGIDVKFEPRGCMGQVGT